MLEKLLKQNASDNVLKKNIRIFFLKLFALIVGWECLYMFILKPLRIPDKMLTNFIASCVTSWMKFFFYFSPGIICVENPMYSNAMIMQNGRPLFTIEDGCNGLDLILIYLVFIILLPSSLYRKIIFGIGGIITITVANIIRCVLLYWIYIRHPQLFEINHHYLFTIAMYLLIFFGWILFIKQDLQNEAG